MTNTTRNTFVDGSWVLHKIVDTSLCNSFDCGDSDLNEYFHVDIKLHKEELLTQSYCFYETTKPDLVLALLDFCNDSVRLENYKNVINLDKRKQYRSLPAVKLTRFGVSKQFQGCDIGTHVINMVKTLFTTDNRTGCRFITVDAYNDSRVINFYEKSGFQLFTEKDKQRETRSMFFDLKRFVNS